MIMKFLEEQRWKKIRGSIIPFIRYYFTIHLNSGETIEGARSVKYLRLNCNYGAYLLKTYGGVTIESRYYPKESIKFIEVVDSEEKYVYAYNEYWGMCGITEEQVKENYEQYGEYIERYKKERENGRD